jgi:GTP-binding protein
VFLLAPSILYFPIVLLILDATAGVTEQDRILAQKIADDGRACVIICNKWDAVVDKDSSTYDKSVKYMRAEMPQIRWAPIMFISAETGQRVGKIYGVVDEAIRAHRKRITTSVLNEVLRDAILWQPPPARQNGAQAKIYYCNHVSTRPPTVVVFCNDPKLVNDNYDDTWIINSESRWMDLMPRQFDGYSVEDVSAISCDKRV